MGFPYVIEVEDREGNKITLNLDSSDETTKWHLSLLCHHDSAIRESIRLSQMTEEQRQQSIVHDSTK